MNNKFFSIIGKIVIAILVIVILLPFALNKWFRNVFNPPKNEIYKYEFESDNPLYKKTMAVYFSEDDIMHIYTYTEGLFGELSGVRLDYRYSGDSYHHLFGPVYVSSTTSLLFWQNYELFNRYTLDKANVRVLLDKMNTLNVTEVEDFDKEHIHTMEISIRTKSIKIDDVVLTLISEDDPTDYLLLEFDRDSETSYSLKEKSKT